MADVEAMRVAIAQNDTATVSRLLDTNPALADAIVSPPDTAIFYAMQSGADAALVGLLLNKSKADINALFPMSGLLRSLNHTLLAYAITQNREDYVALLLARDADPLVKSGAIPVALREFLRASPSIIKMVIDKSPEFRDITLSNERRLAIAKTSMNLQAVLDVEDGRAKRDAFVAASALPMMDVRPYAQYTNAGKVSKVVPVHTTKLPKGTLLFRGIHNLKSMPNDFLGVTAKKVYCLPPQYMVYFYPFPFVDSTVMIYAAYVIYVLTEDIEILSLISPAPLARANRVDKQVPYASCNEIAMGCGLEGREYDPCLKADFIHEYPSIVGMIGIAGKDRAALSRNLTKPDSKLAPYLDTYYGLYKDALSDIPAIPEIVLHPRKTKNMKDLTGTPVFKSAEDFLRWLPDHESAYVYKPYHAFSARNTATIQAFLDERFADKRIQLDATTGFFVDTELAKPEYRGNLVPAGPGAIGTLDPTRLRFTRANPPAR